MKNLILFLLFAIIAFPQGIQDKHKAVVGRMNVSAPPAGSYLPDIVYVAVDSTSSTGDTLFTFTHWGSLTTSHFMLLLLVNEGDASQSWGVGDDTVSTPGWTFVKESGGTAGTNYAHVAMFWKVATAADTGSFTVENSEVREGYAYYLVLDSVDLVNPVNATSDTTNVNNSLDAWEITLEAVTTDADFCLAIGGIATKGSDHLDTPDTLSVTGAGWSLYDYGSNRPGNSFAPSAFILVKDMPSLGSSGEPTLYHGDLPQPGSSGWIIAIKGNN